jgi:transcriptional regulator with XRE-family HTH domain
MNGQLRRLRELRALSLKDLGELSGVDESTIYRLENGRTGRARPSTIRRLAKALGVATEELLSQQGRLED